MIEVSTVLVRLLWAWKVFIGDAMVANYRFVAMFSNFDHSAAVSGLTYYAVTYSALLLSAYLLTYHKHNLLSLFVAEILNISLIVTTFLIPSRAFRFFMGVQNFSYTMIIHAKIFDLAYFYFKSPKSKKRFQLKKVEHSQTTSLESTWSEYVTFVKLILGLGVPKHIMSKYTFPIPYGVYDVVFFFVVSVVGDICTYLLREYIPHYISQSNQVWGMAVVGSLWQITALEFGYYFLHFFCNRKGLLLPVSLWHKNPLLSTSIGEFWGIRWNPVISKQLQDSYYKPLRILGAPRIIGMFGTFLGSALIHAVPALISSDGDRADCYSMFYFFYYQGIGIIVEVMGLFLYKYVLQVFFPKLYLLSNLYKKQIYLENAKHLSIAKEPKVKNVNKSHHVDHIDGRLQLHLQQHNSVKNYHFVELIVVALIMYFSYAWYEVGFNIYAASIAFILTIFVFYHVVMCYHKNIGLVEPGVANSSTNPKSDVRVTKKKLQLIHIPLYVKAFVNGGIIFGWVWTVACLMTQLPFFVLPMMKVINEFYSESFAIGPIVRTVVKFLHYYG